MLKAGVLKPVHEATPWINSFVLVEGNDQHGQPKTPHMSRPHKPQQGYCLRTLSL